eukprot:3058554-Pyramimonas_sp.AAC.1
MTESALLFAVARADGAATAGATTTHGAPTPGNPAQVQGVEAERLAERLEAYRCDGGGHEADAEDNASKYESDFESESDTDVWDGLAMRPPSTAPSEASSVGSQPTSEAPSGILTESYPGMPDPSEMYTAMDHTLLSEMPKTAEAEMLDLLLA